MKRVFSILLLTVISFLGVGIFQAYSEVYKQNAVVSYYGSEFHGKKTSNGEYFNMYELTCASKTLPFNTVLKVTNLANGRSVNVRVNDRGPFVVGRELDLSKAAAIKLDMIKSGTAHVKIEIVKLGPNTKLSQQTAASAEKIMAKKTGNSSAAAKKINFSPEKNYVFQMGAFSSKENAKKLASKLKKDGFNNIVLQTTSNGLVRVVIKPVPGSKGAELNQKLLQKGYKDFQIKQTAN